MSVLQNQYQNLKTKYPCAIIWYSLNNFIESFSECAFKTSSVLNTILTNRMDNGLLLTGFPIKSLDKNIKKMIKYGYTIVIVEI